MINDTVHFYDFFKIFLIQNKIQLKLRPFHEEVCKKLEAIVLGKTDYRYVVLNLPPRIGKTKIMEALCAWQLAHFPESHIIYTSYASDLAMASTRYVLQTIQSKWFILLFGAIAGSVQQAAYFHTKYKGVLKGDGTGGGLTGFGAGLKKEASGFIIVDDPAKPSEALSKTVSQSIRTWFTNTLLSRKNSPKTPIIICAQRLAEDDLCGHVLKNYPNETLHLKFPAMVDDVSTIEDTISTEDLKSLERVDPFTFYSQYQQEPIILGGNLIKTDWFRYFDDENLNFEYKFFTIDSAMKTKEYNDYTVLSCWGVIGKNLYLVDCLIDKWEAPQLEEVTKEFYKRHRPRVMKVELKASGIGLFQKLSQLGFPITGIERFKDKYSRCLTAIPFISLGAVYLKKDLSCLPYILSEAAGFRADLGHKHDDFCDTMFDAIEHIYGPDSSVLDAL